MRCAEAEIQKKSSLWIHFPTLLRSKRLQKVDNRLSRNFKKFYEPLFLIRFLLLVLIGFVASTNSLWAAQPQTIPGQRLEREVQSVPEPIKRPLVIDRPRYAEQVPSGAEAATFILSTVNLRGNHVFTDEELAEYWQSQLGETISLADAFAYAEKISAKYRAKGYLLSQAIIPRQDLNTEGAELTIDIVEGYVAKVSFYGATDSVSTELQSYATAITSEKPLTLKTLERNLLLINELAGLSARANIKQSNTPGASDLEIALERDSRAYSIGIHNRTSEAVGDVRIESSAEVRGAIGNFDRHSLRYITSGSERLNYLGYSGETPVASNGFKLNWSLSKSKAKPEVDIPFNVDSDSESFGAGFSYPLVRSRVTNFDVRLGFAGSNNSSSAQFETQDDIRAIRFGVTWDLMDSLQGVSILDAEISRGLNAFGASENGASKLSRNGFAEPQFIKETLYLARLQSLGGPFTLLLAAQGQHSNDVLVNSETFGLGGDLFLRAYDPSELIGDSGAAGKIELRCDVSGTPLATTIYAYHDAGAVYFNTSNSSHQSILSNGVGIRFTVPHGIHGYIEFAKPKHRSPASTGDEDARVFGGLFIDF